MSKSILITGATGFVGQYLVQELVKNNYDISATIRKAEDRNKLPEKVNSFVVNSLNDTFSRWKSSVKGAIAISKN